MSRPIDTSPRPSRPRPVRNRDDGVGGAARPRGVALDAPLPVPARRALRRVAARRPPQARLSPDAPALSTRLTDRSASALYERFETESLQCAYLTTPRQPTAT